MQQGVEEKEIEKEMKKWEMNREKVLADREAKKLEKLGKKNESSQSSDAEEAPSEEAPAEEAPAEEEAAEEAAAHEESHSNAYDSAYRSEVKPGWPIGRTTTKISSVPPQELVAMHKTSPTLSPSSEAPMERLRSSYNRTRTDSSTPAEVDEE